MEIFQNDKTKYVYVKLALVDSQHPPPPWSKGLINIEYVIVFVCCKTGQKSKPCLRHWLIISV